MSLPQPDLGVLRKAQRGDERAFSLIVRAYEVPVFNYVMRLVGHDRALAYAVGEAIFFRRSGQWDFACATCHAEDNRRIRLQGLPNLTKPGKAVQDVMSSWPTYRVSQSQTRTMQHRLWGCFRQMRWAEPDYLADGVTALTIYLNKNAEGGILQVPSIKR